MTTKYEQEERIYYSAITFRRLLDSLARPGKITTLDVPHFLGELPDMSFPLYPEASTFPVPLNAYALGALMTLLDKEVTFALAADGMWSQSNASVMQWISLRCGARVAPPNVATFAFLCDSASSILLPQLHAGTLLEPETSTTAFCCVEQLTSIMPVLEDNADVEEWLQLSLNGPGIDGSRTLYVSQSASSLMNSIIATRQRYPLGIDVYLVDVMGRCVGLPRTTHIQH